MTRGTPNPPQKRTPSAEIVEEIENDALPDVDEEIATFVAHFGQAKRVSVLKYNPTTDRYVHQGSIPAEMVTEDVIQRRWKGGNYKLTLHDEAGRLVRVRTGIEIADPLPVDDATRAAVSTPAAAAPPDAFALMKAQNDQMHAMVLALINRPAPQTDLSAMLQLADRMNKNQPATSPKDMMDMFLKGMEMADGGGSRGGGDEMMEMLKPMAIAAMSRFMPAGNVAKPGAATQNPEGESVEEEESPDDSIFAEIVSFVKPAIASDANTDLMARMVIAASQRDEGQLELLTMLLEQPFPTVLKQLSTIDPELAQEPAAAWLNNFYTSLNNALHNMGSAEHSAKPGRNGGNHKRDAGTHVSGATRPSNP